MRIAFFTEVFLPKVDGVVHTLCRFFEYLAKHGHEAIIVTTSYTQERRPPIEEITGARIVRVPGVPFLLYPEIRLAPPWLANHPELDRFQPDLVHVVNPVVLGAGGIVYARRHHLPLVASYQTDLPGFARRWGLGYTSPAMWAFLRSLHNQAHLNLAPSEFTRKELLANNFRRVKIWTRGVDTQVFNPGMVSDEWRQRLSGGAPEQPLLLFTGRLSSEKRVAWLRAIFDRYPEVRLAIVGDGPQRLELESLFSGTHTHFTGYLRGNDLAHAYASCDAFVFPGANETFGNVVLEAMASGLAVVVPDSGGVLDFVSHNVNGLVFHAENRSSFVEQAGRLINQPGLRRSLADNAQLVVNNRSWSEVFEKLLNDYAWAIQVARRSYRVRGGYGIDVLRM